MMTDDKEIRQTLAQALVERAKEDSRIVVLDADLMSCHATKCFKEAFPNRFFNVGIAEQNMIGIDTQMLRSDIYICGICKAQRQNNRLRAGRCGGGQRRHPYAL